MNIIFLFIIFLVLLVLGIPVGFGLLLSAVIGIITNNLPLFALPLKMFSGLDNYPFLAIPLFILAGNIMNETGITSRLIDLSNSLIGSLRSSLGQVNILTSMFFAGVSGSDVADASAIGSTLIPAMVKNGYTKEEAAIITGTSATIGPIIPPSIRMVIYGALTGTSIIGLFLAGVLPGILLGFSLMLLTYILSIIRKDSMGNIGKRTKFSFINIIRSLKDNIFVVPIPVLVVWGIYGGFFTVTEAGVFLVFYNLIISKLIYKSFDFEKFKRVFLKSALTTSYVGIIISAASVFSYLLSTLGFATWIMNAFSKYSNNPTIFLMLICLIFFILGCFVPITIILIVFSPYLPTINRIIGLHPLHLGLVVVVVLALGTVTPPYGTILYIVSYLADTSVIKCIPTLLPYLIAMIFVVLLVIFCSPLSLFIPKLLGFG